MSNFKRPLLAAAVAVTATLTMGAGGCDENGSSDDNQSTGGSEHVQEDTQPTRLQVNATGGTFCNPKGGKVTITGRGLTPQASYKVEVYTPLFRDHGKRVKRWFVRPDASGLLSTSFMCKGHAVGAYEVIITDPNTAADGADAFDVYSVAR